MTIARTARPATIFRSFGLRAAGSRTGGQARHLGRRTYASEGHGGQKKASSDLPWLIGAVVFTVPSATWLWQQGPTKTPHHDHSHDEKHGDEEGEATEEGESKEESDGDKETESNEKSEDDGDSGEKAKKSESSGDDTEESAEESEDSKSDDTDAEKKKDDSEESQESEKGDKSDKADKSENSDKSDKAKEPTSKSVHPYMADPEKSKKGEGIPETAKIHGTVDRDRNVR